MRRLASFFRRLNQRSRDAARGEATAAPRSFGRRARGWLGYVAYVFSAVAAIWIVLELALLLAHAVSRSNALTTLDADESFAIRLYPEYPGDPDRYAKIAVFGGSTAAGHHSTRGFSDMIEYELRKRFPQRPVFLKNYALPGYPFHRHQAEYVKLLIDKYDVLLIYCGNNEAENWFDDSGYYRNAEYKDASALPFRRPVEARSRWLTALEKYSRIFALVTRAKGQVGQIDAPISKNKAPHYQEFERADVLPPEERQAIVKNFERDLVEICELAERQNKQILLSVTATHEKWPPCYSFFRPDTTEKEKQQWHEIYQAGMAELNGGNHEAAAKTFRRAAEIDADVAILNHRIGLCYLQLGDPEKGRRFLRRAIDQEGFNRRSTTSLHQKARALCQQFACLHYVDCVAAVNQATSDGIADEEIFSDYCHMRLLGHAVVGRAFLDELLKLEPFRSWRPATVTGPDESDWRLLRDYYHRKLGVTEAEEETLAIRCINFFFAMSQFTAYPERCFEQIDERIRHFESLSDDSPRNRVIAKMSRARVALGRGSYELATQRINEALAISPIDVRKILSFAAWNHYVYEEFVSAGVVYDKQSGKFVLTRAVESRGASEPMH